MHRIGPIAVLLACCAAPANAADLTLTTTAMTGADSRPVRITFGCSANNGPQITGALRVEMAVPDTTSLKPVFDFDPFEGPDADAGPRTGLVATTAQGGAQAAFTASGGYGSENSFNLGVDAAMRRDAARLKSLASVLRPLTTGAGTLRWTQSNTSPGGASIVARVAVSAEDAVRLKALLAPCLAAAG